MNLISKSELLLFCLFLLGFGGIANAQFTDPDLNVDDNKLRMEFEPGLFFNNGRSLNALYTVTPDNNFSVGVYLMASDVPEDFHSSMFDNVMDSSHIRATQEYAFNFRYRLRISKNIESNPYVGLILGWEEILLTHPSQNDLTYTTFLVTPHLGYELYLYKKMLYLNTQIRSVFYVGAEKSDDARPETLRSYWVLPSISIGLRI